MRRELIGCEPREGGLDLGSKGGSSKRRASDDASLYSWLSFFADDLYQHSYDMFHDLPHWMSPHRSSTRQGDLGRITSNMMDLDAIEEFDPELKPFYDLLRSASCFDDLTIPGATPKTTDRVRLTAGQLSDVIDWTIVDEIDYRPIGHPVGIFTVPKRSTPDLLRFIVDGRPWNQTQQDPIKMPIPELRQTVFGLQRKRFAVQYDGVSFFYQFRMEHDRIHFRRNGKNYKMNRMPMGWKWAPTIAQHTGNAILKQVLKESGLAADSVYTACWVDNFLLSADTKEQLDELVKTFLSICARVSLEVKKEEAASEQHTMFAGIQHDLQEHRYRPRVSENLVQKCETLRDVMKNCGACIWQVYGRGRKLCYYRDLINFVSRLCTPALAGDQSWDSPLQRYLRKGDDIHLERLYAIASDESWEVPDLSQYPADSVETYSDASSYMWAFSTDMTTGGQGFFRKGSKQHIFVKEGIALLAAVAAEAPNFRHRHRTFRVDNLPLVHAFAKGHSPNITVNNILCRVFDIIKEHQVQVSVVWVATDLNLVDKYSRGTPISFPRVFRRRLLAEPLLTSHSAPNFSF